MKQTAMCTSPSALLDLRPNVVAAVVISGLFMLAFGNGGSSRLLRSPSSSRSLLTTTHRPQEVPW
jgi:hypothetical protein